MGKNRNAQASHSRDSNLQANNLVYGQRSDSDATTIRDWSDRYFSRTSELVKRYGDCHVKYALFMRRPILCALSLALSWLEQVAEKEKQKVSILRCFKEGDWVGAGEPLCYIEGSFAFLSMLETLLLQKIGFCCVAANNAYDVCVALPQVQFLAMDARHCAGLEMAEMAAYGASVGSLAAIQNDDAQGFIGCSTQATTRFFSNKEAFGTMPHGLIGYAGSTLRAAEMFAETFPSNKLVVLVDYFGQEITDALEVCEHFVARVEHGEVSIRLDTHGGRFVQGLDTASSYALLERNAPKSLRGYRSESVLKHLIGTGVSAAAVWHLRENLDKAGYNKVSIIASSGFTTEKCLAFALAQTPVEIIGTGSYLPEKWSETQATSDIVCYNGKERVKLGREFLLPSKNCSIRE